MANVNRRSKNLKSMKWTRNDEYLCLSDYASSIQEDVFSVFIIHLFLFLLFGLIC